MAGFSRSGSPTHNLDIAALDDELWPAFLKAALRGDSASAAPCAHLRKRAFLALLEGLAAPERLTIVYEQERGRTPGKKFP